MKQAEEDDLIHKSPCRIKGGSNPHTPPRPTATLAEIFALADAFPERYRLMPLMAAFYQPRRGELLALTRADVEDGLRINKRIYPIRGRLDVDLPKTKAGTRTVPSVAFMVPLVEEHLARFVGPELDALIFSTSTGRPVTYLHTIWDRARLAIGRPDLHFQDLRHSGATVLRIYGGATDEEIQARLGHASPWMSRHYTHTTNEHSRAVSQQLSEALEAHSQTVPIRGSAPVWRR